MTRVVVVTWKYPNPTEPFVVDHVAALARRGIDFAVVTSSDRRGIRRLPAWVDNRADIIHFQQLNLAQRHRHLLPSARGATVITIRGSDVRVAPLASRAVSNEISEVFAVVDRLHCVSADLATRCVELGAPPDRLHIAPLGIDLRRFAPRTHPQSRHDDELRIVSVGRLHWVKGYEYALQAIRLLTDAGQRVSYTIVGVDEGAGELLRLAIHDLGLEEAVTLAGPVQHRDVLAVLARSDLFLLPSVSEGLSQATVEAMAVGVPVVVTDVGGMRELVCDGEHGRVVPSRRPDELARAIVDLADPDIREAMGRRASAHVHARYDVDTQVDRLVAMYRELAPARRTRQRAL